MKSKKLLVAVMDALVVDVCGARIMRPEEALPLIQTP